MKSFNRCLFILLLSPLLLPYRMAHDEQEEVDYYQKLQEANLNGAVSDTIIGGFLYYEISRDIKVSPLRNGTPIFDDVSDFVDEIQPTLARLDEQEFQVIKRTILVPWRQKWASGKPNISKLFHKNAMYTPLSNIGKKVTKSFDQIDELVWAKNQRARRINKNSFKKYIAHFSRIDDLDLFALSVKSHHLNRDVQRSYRMNKAEMLVRFDIRGINKESKRQNDRGIFKLSLVRKKKSWIINKHELLNGESLVSHRRPSFKEITSTSGLTVKTHLRTEAIRRGGYALSTTDYDNDGKVDLLAGTAGQTQLFKGNGQGEFTEIQDPIINNVNLVKTAVFADLNNSGSQDLVLVRFALQDRKSLAKDVVILKNKNGRFIRDYKLKSKKKFDYAMPATVADFNKDNYLDLYVGFPGPRDFTVLDRFLPSVDKASAKKTQGIFLNNKKGTFIDQNFDDHLPFRDSALQQSIQPHSVLAADYDLDGDMDILVVDDNGNLSPTYRNSGNGHFSQVSKKIGLGNTQYGMGVAAGDFNNDGRIDIAYSNVNFNSALRIRNSAKLNYDLDALEGGVSALRLFKGVGQDGNFVEVTESTNISWPGEGLACVEFIDYNNDGLLDIYVANGLWSGTDKEHDISDLYANFLWKNESNLEIRDHLVEQTQGRSIIMTLLMTYRGNLFGAKKKERLSLAGHQRNRLYRNNGDNTFTDVGYLEGVDSLADGYVIASADINNDQKMDIVLRNGDPGSQDIDSPAIQVFLNQGANKRNKSVVLKLQGQKSNRDAIGTTVVAHVGDSQIIRQLLANNGAAQSERLIHIGLGTHKYIDKLQIKWPSGKSETIKNIHQGFYQVVEGKKFNGQLTMATTP